MNNNCKHEQTYVSLWHPGTGFKIVKCKCCGKRVA
jgi:hypothetical protein